MVSVGCDLCGLASPEDMRKALGSLALWVLWWGRGVGGVTKDF